VLSSCAPQWHALHSLLAALTTDSRRAANAANDTHSGTATNDAAAAQAVPASTAAATDAVAADALQSGDGSGPDDGAEADEGDSAAPAAAAAAVPATDADADEMEELLTAEHVRPLRRGTTRSSRDLSQRLYRAASRMLAAHAKHVDLHALLLVPEVNVELRYLPHGCAEERGLLDVTLRGSRAELTTNKVSWLDLA
jgi:hypothetical protein